MEWIRISENKLKIMLTAADAERYALRPDEADLADGITRRAFREILADAGEVADFDAAEDRVYIQIYPSREGGCELFVTRREIKTADVHKKGGRRAVPAEDVELAFAFDGMSALIHACRRLHTQNFFEKSRAFTDTNGHFWLLLRVSGPRNEAWQRFSFLREYGKEASAATAIFLLEHGTEICKNCAVQRLAVM